MNDLAMRLREREGLDPVLTFGAGALAAAAYVAYARMQSWAAFPLFLLVAIPCALLFYLALVPTDGIPRRGEPATRWQVALLAIAHFLLLITLISIVPVLGDDNPGSATATWTLAVTSISAFFFAERLDSPGLRLLSLLAFAIAALALVNWIDSDASASAYRDVLLVEGVIFLLFARNLHGVRPSHSHVEATAAAITLVAGATLGAFGGIQVGLFGGLSAGDLGDNDGWELLLIAVSLGALAYSAWERYRGTIYPGLLGLVFFLGVGAAGNLWGWPVILTLVAIACFWWALYGDASLGRRRPATPPSATPPPGAQEESSGM